MGQKARERFCCYYKDGKFIVPSEYVIRDVLIRVNSEHLDQVLQLWNTAYAKGDESPAIDGKTMCNAIDEEGYQTHIMNQTHIMSAVAIRQKFVNTQKKSVQSR